MMTPLTYGVYAALLSIVITLVEYFAGIDQMGAGRYLGFLGIVALIAAVYMAIRDRRDDEFGGTLTTGQALGTGALVGVASGILTSIFMYLYLTQLNPDFGDAIIEQTRRQMEAQHTKPEIIESALNITRIMVSPTVETIITLLGGPLTAFIISLLLSVRYTAYVTAVILFLWGLLNLTVRGLPVSGVVFLVVGVLFILLERISSRWRFQTVQKQITL